MLALPLVTQGAPPAVPFQEFREKYSLSATSTEKTHPLTANLSQVMEKDVVEGLKILNAVDREMVAGYERFIHLMGDLVPNLYDRLLQGRLFLVGSGSSGRVAIDLAAKAKQTFQEHEQKIEGVIAGGDSAFIRAREGFEDSDQEGARALEGYNLSEKDTVILISASGSAPFNAGLGHAAAERGAKVYYFYNSESIPDRTEQLFKRKKNPVHPLCVDVGPQAISGSTRLQAATLAEMCLGNWIASSFFLLNKDLKNAVAYKRNLERFRMGLCNEKFQAIAGLIRCEKELFSDPRANFRKLRDDTNWGYVTVVSDERSIREVLVDATEMSPTFSIHPIRREDQGYLRRGEYRAYLLGSEDNQHAWKRLIGRAVSSEESASFLLSTEADGINSYKTRPKGKGNLLIGVAKIRENEPISERVLKALEEAKKEGGHTALICLSSGRIPPAQYDCVDHRIMFEYVPHDPMGIIETVYLKQTLNMISNGAMLLMHKVHGNKMIDVRPSNNKLIDRCIRLIKEITDPCPWDDQRLYETILAVNEARRALEEKGEYSPSVVKILAVMVKRNINFKKAVRLLLQNEENLNAITA